MMMKSNKQFKLGDATVQITKATDKSVVLKLTGKECGFVTLMQLNANQLKSIYEFIMGEAIVERGDIQTCIVEFIHAKHREYTKNGEETDFSYKYYESKNSQLQLVTIGAHCVVSLNTENKHYRTLSFRTYDVLDTLRKMAEAINLSMGEAMMQF